jgi:hypothetical protein
MRGDNRSCALSLTSTAHTFGWWVSDQRDGYSSRTVCFFDAARARGQVRWVGTAFETEPMFFSFFIALGPFLLLAARNPSVYRPLIAFAAWWSLAHAAVITIETVQAWNRGVHRDFMDVIIADVIGFILLALSPPAVTRAESHRGN